jgi:hypothetical protein
MFKDARLTQNDEFYLVTDTEGNIGIICFWNLIEVTDPQLLQRNMAKISFTRYLEYCEPYKENMAKLSLARNFQVSG